MLQRGAGFQYYECRRRHLHGVCFLEQPCRRTSSRCLVLRVLLCADLGDLHLLLLAHSGCHSSSGKRHGQLWQFSAKCLTNPVKSVLSVLTVSTVSEQVEKEAPRCFAVPGTLRYCRFESRLNICLGLCPAAVRLCRKYVSK